ncbi:MAG: hypothetical protein NVS3B23_09600 [Candidatus Saccharimonadales bacterium]
MHISAIKIIILNPAIKSIDCSKEIPIGNTFANTSSVTPIPWGEKNEIKPIPHANIYDPMVLINGRLLFSALNAEIYKKKLVPAINQKIIRIEIATVNFFPFSI